MKLFNLFSKQTPQSESVVVTPKVNMGTDFKTFNINCDYSTSNYNLVKTSKGYLYGPDGLIPQELNDLFGHSPLHSSIILFKKLLTVGQGYTIDTSMMGGIEKISVNQLTNQFDEFLDEIGMDYFIHSRICLEVTWNKDNTKILKIKRIAPEKIHINNLNKMMEPIDYLYNWDWVNYSRYETIKLPAFDPLNKKDKVQLYVYQTQSPGQKLYSEPSYRSAIPWVLIDKKLSYYHDANISNSIYPSLLLQYYEKPGTKEEKQQVLIDLNNSFAGARKAGRAMVTFSDGKDLAPTVTQMEPNKLDKTFLGLTNVIQYQITYAHQIDPVLLGLAKPAGLGDSNDLQESYLIFNASVIKPAQKCIEKILNTFLSINGISAKIELNNTSLFASVSEATDIVKDEKLKDTKTPSTEVAPLPVNDAVKSLSAKEHQQLIRIIRQYSKGQITKQVASTLIRTGLGLNEGDIELMLQDNED